MIIIGDDGIVMEHRFFFPSFLLSRVSTAIPALLATSPTMSALGSRRYSAQLYQHDLCRSENQAATFPEPQQGPKPIRLWSTREAVQEDDENEGEDVNAPSPSPISDTETATATATETPTTTTTHAVSPRRRRASMPGTTSTAVAEQAASSSPPSSPHRPRRRQSMHRYVVAGLSKDYPERLLAPYRIEPAFWQRFIAAINAALSEFPAWKNPQELAAGRRRRRFSFDASMSAASPRGNRVWWTDDTCGASGRDRAEKVLRWWNEDYFRHKGCWITLGFHRDDVPSSARNDGEESVCDVTSGQSIEDTIHAEQKRRATMASVADAIRSSSARDASAHAADTSITATAAPNDNGGGNSTLKPFLTVRPI
ncbi:hypothetical protein SYNPS1DRAFT_26711 [Syncephalis pseudoplumigaleata]|uniref:Uncharacterized protein n=1 Tax=Syncephalis pseudoplumigaleata TaxID=1712513 RepID=A0A4P9Z571_9FUNG|nr:hypothetical protein SYNPS1DRAFT_26711 [Syncephalis pseudoplumigaleata]|eukprot:RKP27645.1 hypothetical protein SYNPS1DRAFT_26711 [Syncephalis pseudoplumigaleata]